MMDKYVVFILSCAVLCSAAVTELNYKKGQEFVYTLHSNVDARGHDSTTGERTSGSYATMDSVVVTQVVDMDSSSYLFVMNMFNTVVDVGQGPTSALGSTKQTVNSGSDSLGYDMYFQQKKTGEIEKIWYNTADSPYFVNVKVGAINAFQTFIVPPGKTQSVLENDPVGVHYSSLQGSNGASSALLLNKTFNAADVQAFADPNLKPSNVRINAVTNTGIHSAGYIQSSSVDQLVDLINVGTTMQQRASELFKGPIVGDNADSAVNSMLSSKGHLEITISQVSQTPSLLNSGFGFSALSVSPNHTGDTMFNVAAYLIAQPKDFPSMDLEKATLANILTMPSSHKASLLLLSKVISHLEQHPSDIQMLNEFAQKVNTDTNLRQNLFYVLANVDNAAAHKLLIQAGINVNAPKNVILNAIFAIHDIATPSKDLLVALRDVAELGDADVQHAALLAYGSVCGHLNEYPAYLFDFLKSAKSDDDRITAIHAIGNAGPTAVALKQFPVTALMNPNPEVRRAALFALRKYEQPQALMMIEKFVQDTQLLVSRTAQKLLTKSYKLEDSDFPFNKSYIKNLTLGGKELAANFNGELFLGTNFDCNQQYFNYEALADVESILHAFGASKSAFEAEAIYGKKNGALIGNRVFVRVWNSVIYDKTLPTVDCNEHTYNIAHTSKGLSLSYTLWVSVIPVTFSLTGSLTLDLGWGWQICDSQLSAMVELIPKATLSIAGGAEINLLIIRAGVDLTGSFNTQIRPQGYIHGANCSLGIDVRQISDPMSIDFTSYYAWKQCKLWIFDCHWGNHNEHTWFHWSLPSVDKVLFEQDWKIQP